MHGSRPGLSLAASDMTVRRVSSGGVGAKMGSSPGPRIWRATSLERTFGDTSSLLFVSTHLTDMAPRPVTLWHSLFDLFAQTPFDSKYCSSLVLACRTKSGFSNCPVRSSRKTSPLDGASLSIGPPPQSRQKPDSVPQWSSQTEAIEPTKPLLQAPSASSCFRIPISTARQSRK